MSIRYLLHDDESPFSEAVGMVQSISPEAGAAATLKLVDRRGDPIIVPLADVVAAKAF